MITDGVAPNTVFGRLISNGNSNDWLVGNMSMLAIMTVYPLRQVIENVCYLGSILDPIRSSQNLNFL